MPGTCQLLLSDVYKRQVAECAAAARDDQPSDRGALAHETLEDGRMFRVCLLYTSRVPHPSPAWAVPAAAVVHGTAAASIPEAHLLAHKINEAYDTILRADKVTAEMIPALCDYVIFSENGEKIGGDLSEQYEPVSYTHLDVYKRQP